MTKPELNSILLRSADLPRSLGFYGLLGLKFHEEKHNNGPVHYATEIGSVVLELYPRGKLHPTTGVRLGLIVDSVDAIVDTLEHKAIIFPPNISERGKLAVVADPDGHKIELLEQSDLTD